MRELEINLVLKLRVPEDGLTVNGILKSLFGRIPVFDLTKERLEKIDPADLKMIHQLVQQTQQGFEQLLEALDQDRYPKARTYIRNLYQHTMTFLDYWLQNKQWIPLNTNAIESAFSQIANRIKKIGQRVSDRDLLQGLILTLAKIFRPEFWDQFWKQYMRINRKMNLIMMRKTRYAWL